MVMIPVSRQKTNRNEARAGEADQLLKCLLYKHKDLSSIPRASEKQLGVVACICNPGTGEAEKGKSRGLRNQPRLAGELELVRDLVSKKSGLCLRNCALGCHLTSTCMCLPYICMYRYTHINTHSYT